MILPRYIVMNPAPLYSLTFLTVTSYPSGLPSTSLSSDIEYCVLDITTGNLSRLLSFRESKIDLAWSE